MANPPQEVCREGVIIGLAFGDDLTEHTDAAPCALSDRWIAKIDAKIALDGETIFFGHPKWIPIHPFCVNSLMFLTQLFQMTEGLLGHYSRKASIRMLLDRGWVATTVPDEYRHPDAPGYSVDLEPDSYQDQGPFAVYYGSRKIGVLPYPPYASHLAMRSSAAAPASQGSVR